ncbi:restriction endonuclease [Rummeliibacillus suwonensis]|uniref:restriction endonuclease n=1 Tax=Rummeliibacillus suwonensis TaxID=1306154 RepID=UPI00289A3342|nr:restriction endonuclease [Rummeliibacillus suwonensis]
MSNRGYYLKKYLEAIDLEHENILNEFRFTSDELSTYNELLNNLITTNSNSSSSSTEKGKVLEDIVSFIMEKSIIFSVCRNVRTSTNEIDLLVQLNYRGIALIKDGIIPQYPPFLCECKNYYKTISVTWVGKFYSLLKTSKNNFGILFSYNGFSGKGWSNANGLAKKIYLTDQSKIIDFSLEDFRSLANKSFLEILNEKIFNLENDVCITQFISNHPNEQAFDI